MRLGIRFVLLFSLIVFPAISGANEMSYSEKCQEIIDAKGKMTEGERLQNLFDINWAQRMQDYPEWGSSLGYPGLADRWTDQSLEAIEERKSRDNDDMRVLESIDRGQLSEEEKLNYDLFKWHRQDDIDDHAFLSELMPINQMGGVYQSAAYTFTDMPTDKLSQCEDIVSRLKAVPEQIAQTVVLMKKGLEEGITPPKVTLRDVPELMSNQIVDDPLQAPMLKWLTRMGEYVSNEDKERLTSEASATYLNNIVPALTQLRDFFVNDYLPNCRESIAMSDLPDGKAWYGHRVKHYTTVDLTPEQIHQIGLDEVARIRSEMEGIIASVGFKGDFSEFCEFLRTDDRFFYETADELLTGYRDISKRIDPELIRLFGHLPRLPYGVEPVPDYAAKSQTTAYYEGGSLKAGRPGTFFANTYDLRSRPKWEMEALTLHEAVPGHHFQIAVAQELDNLPEFRRYGWFTAYGEGWGLYSESLGKELGLYQDPYSKFGQLTYEMWRAIRLVVDVGMHYKGWSRQQAIDFFMENSCKAEHDIVVEVDRYIVWPGQALAYKMGELKIKELRASAEQELGDQFDVRAFHDHMLASGPLPLAVLEARMEDWIQSQKTD